MSSHSSPSQISARRDNNPSKTKTPELGKPLGIYDANSVRDRVRQWQAHVGGAIGEEPSQVGENLDGVPSEGRTESKSGVPKTSSRSHENDGKHPSAPIKADKSPTKPVHPRHSPPHSVSAPAKRVVSDGHWRKKRSPPKSSSYSKDRAKDSAPMGTQPDGSIRVEARSEARLDQGRGGGGHKNEPKLESVGEDDGVRVYATSPDSRRHPERPRRLQSVHSGDELSGGSDLETVKSSPQHLEKPKARPAPERSSHVESYKSREEGRRRQGSVQQDHDEESRHSAQGALSEGKRSLRSHKGSILSQVFGDSKKNFAKQIPEPIPAPRIPSIEAWLDETPDPFAESNESPIEERPPLNPSPRRKSTKSDRISVQDPNRIWDALDTKEGTRRAVTSSVRKRRIPSSAIREGNPFPEDLESSTTPSVSGKETTTASKFIDLVQESPNATSQPQPSPPLRRAGAKKASASPSNHGRKSRTPETSTKQEDPLSVSSSDITPSVVQNRFAKNRIRPPGLNAHRPFPSTGTHRLSTIASVETFNTKTRDATPPSVSDVSELPEEANLVDGNVDSEEARDYFDPNSLKRNNSRLTKHADLISVLSLPKAGGKSIKSARSVRTNRSRLATATIGDLMQELATDENKYMRELRTLVDGVIPVLLTCVLSKSDSAVAAGLFRPSANVHDDPNFTRPIVDMGIALERLKTLHKRIPQEDPTALLTWAHGAQRVYGEYLEAWRMGFQDVVVNLAPAAEDTPSSKAAATLDARDPGLEAGLPRNENGDVVNGDGERVDVAFLLKRPLVRLKYLAKTLRGISVVKPSSEADKLAQKYQDLVEKARQRSNEERARLEDEAAANIDPTRAREPRTLAPLSGVAIDRTRRVRARDNFNLALQHSTGQRVDCRIELLLRDEASEVRHGGDLLICEVDGSGRWLLFPPVQCGLVSARNGDVKGEIVIMIRGKSGGGSEWQELLSLLTEEEEVAFEWVQMLGLTPVPPKIARSQSFITGHRRKKSAPEKASPAVSETLVPSSPSKSRTPSPREVEVPIGEQANEDSKPWWETATIQSPTSIKTSPREPSKLQKRIESSPATPSRSTNYVDQVNDLRSLPSQNRARESQTHEPARTPRSFKEALGLSGSSTMVGLKRTKAKRMSKHLDTSPSSPRSRRSYCDSDSHPSSPEVSEVHSRPSDLPITPDKSSFSEPKMEVDSERMTMTPESPPMEDTRPPHRRSKSSVPSMDLPYIPKARKNSPPVTPTIEPEEEPVWSVPPQSQHPRSSSKLTKKNPNAPKYPAKDDPPAPALPIHRTPKSANPKESKTPVLEKNQAKPRRSSSPLKHEYEPSTASESSSESDASTVERNEATSVSDSSEDDGFEDEDVPTPLIALQAHKKTPSAAPKSSIYSVPNGSIKPSDSASQAPYKKVPAQPAKAAKTIASIYSWSDSGSWNSLYPDECSIIITPGLIEAFEMSAAHSNRLPLSSPAPVVDVDKFSDMVSTVTSQNDDVRGERPLIALELTPLVPLRRGTALDISIRSPPTSNSQITSGSNIMFRSRNAEECEALYALINHSRINNPTFIALQNARPTFTPGKFAGSTDRRPGSRSASAKSSWFGGWGRSSSYRASSAPTPSVIQSESSIGSMSSAFSALKRFGKHSGGGMFNIARSTIMSRDGSRSNSVYTSSDNSSGSGAASPLPPWMANTGKDGAIGLSNAKIRIYIRETASKWRDMGSARLTIMPAERNSLGPDGAPLSGGGQPISHEKRIIVNGNTKGEVLLDAQLGESCFERVARTGIAVSVWEDVVGPNGEIGMVGPVGGVAGGRAKVYMIQMKSEAETAYTFSIVGKLRY